MALPASLTDNELLSQLREGSTLAFTEIYNQHWKFLYNSAYRILRHQDDAKDICQQLFTWLWENRDAVMIRSSFRAYLYTALKYKIANFIRDGRVRENLFEGLEDIDVAGHDNLHLEVKELKHLINQLIHELPPRCREIFLMSREGQLSHQEIADTLDLSVRTVDEQISRALKKLRPALGRLASIILTL